LKPTINVVKERTSANRCVQSSEASATRVVIRERDIADRRVRNAVDIVKQRALAQGVVAVSIYVTKERIGAHGVVELACGIGKQCECAASCVESRGVAQKRAYADCRIFNCSIDQKSAGSDTCVEVGRTVAKERQETKCRVIKTGRPCKRTITVRGVAIR
jgi:hypothetical protein